MIFLLSLFYKIAKSVIDGIKNKTIKDKELIKELKEKKESIIEVLKKSNQDNIENNIEELNKR